MEKSSLIPKDTLEERPRATTSRSGAWLSRYQSLIGTIVCVYLAFETLHNKQREPKALA